MEFLSLRRRRSSARNVLSGEERGETDVSAGYHLCRLPATDSPRVWRDTIYYVNTGLRHQYGISAAESQTFPRAIRPHRRRARRNGCFRRLQRWLSPNHFSKDHAFDRCRAHAFILLLETKETRKVYKPSLTVQSYKKNHFLWILRAGDVWFKELFFVYFRPFS